MSGRGKPACDPNAAKLLESARKQCQRCRNDCGKECIKCNLCESIFHIKCEGISTQQLNLFRDLDKLKTPYEWLCSSCRKMDVMNIMKSIHAMQTKIETLEKEVASLKEMNTNKSQPVESSHTVGSGHTSVSEAVNEAIDIERRKLNLVVSGITQSEQMSDAVKLQNLLEDPILKISGTVLVQNMQRVGNNGNMIISFDTIESKRVVLKSASLLRLSEIPSHRNIYISPDLTRKQRQVAYELRSELKLRRENGEVGLKISKGKIIQTPMQGQSTPHVTSHVIRVSPGTPTAAASNSTQGNPTTPQQHMVQVSRVDSGKKSGIPGPSVGVGRGGGSAASVGVAGSQRKN